MGQCLGIADSRIVANVTPPTVAGVDTPMVTTSAYDTMGRTTDVTVDAIAGAGTSLPDVNLTTHTVYDTVGRPTDVTDPGGHVTHYVYDRLGRVIESDTAWNGSVSALGIKALAGYDALGEVIATCSPVQVAAGCTASGTDTRSWRYGYDAMGHETSATPPANAFTALAASSATYELGGAGRPSTTTQGNRTSTLGYDAAGRQSSSAVTQSGIGTLTTTLTLDSLGRTTQVAASGTASDTLTETYDAVGRLLSMSRSGTNVTSYTYNADGTAASRTDGTTASTFTYTILGQLASASMGSLGYADYAWGLDGNMVNRTWGSSTATTPTTGAMVGTYSYDRAKRPATLSLVRNGSSADTISRTYDRASNVASETQTLGTAGGTGSVLASSGTENYTYDAANRVTASSLTVGSTSETRTYTYDADSNRRSVIENNVATAYYFYDATDAVITKNTTNTAPTVGTACGSLGFCYDAQGDLTASSPSTPDSSAIVATTYTYDPAGHLTGLVAGSQTIGYAIDALGRHRSQTISGSTTTYGYVGTSDSIVSMSATGSTTFSTIDAIGDRLATKVGSTSGYLVADLHGNVIAATSAAASPLFVRAYRYDAYGETCASWYSSTGSIAVPWRFGGRVLESGSGTDLYDFGARSYDPSLGAFTSFDSVAGSAQNPLTLNRYLYALGNPATLIDPDGHFAGDADDERGLVDKKIAIPKALEDTLSPSATNDSVWKHMHGNDLTAIQFKVDAFNGISYTLLDTTTTVAGITTPMIKTSTTVKTTVTVTCDLDVTLGVTMNGDGTSWDVGDGTVDFSNDGGATVALGGVTVGTKSVGAGVDVPMGSGTVTVKTSCEMDGSWLKCDRSVSTKRETTITKDGADYKVEATYTQDFITEIKPPRPADSSGKTPAIDPATGSLWVANTGLGVPTWQIARWDFGDQAGWSMSNGSSSPWVADPGYQIAPPGSSTLVPAVGTDLAGVAAPGTLPEITIPSFGSFNIFGGDDVPEWEMP